MLSVTLAATRTQSSATHVRRCTAASASTRSVSARVRTPSCCRPSPARAAACTSRCRGHMDSVLVTLDSFGGIYVAMFLFAILSGVFPLANSEAALIALGAASHYDWPKLIVLAVVVALGQSVTHAMVYQSAVSYTHLTLPTN